MAHESVITSDGERVTVEYAPEVVDGITMVVASAKEYAGIKGCGATAEEALDSLLAVLGVSRVDAAGGVWRPTSREDVDSLLDRVAQIEAEIVAIQHRRDSIVANMDAQIAALKRRIDSIFWVYGPDIERFARAELAGSKSRTLILDNGVISFRRVPGKRHPKLPMEELVQWAESNMPEIVRVTKRVNVTDLPDEMVEVDPPRDTFTVRTSKGESPIFTR